MEIRDGPARLRGPYSRGLPDLQRVPMSAGIPGAAAAKSQALQMEKAGPFSTLPSVIMVEPRGFEPLRH